MPPKPKARKKLFYRKKTHRNPVLPLPTLPGTDSEEGIDDPVANEDTAVVQGDHNPDDLTYPNWRVQKYHAPTDPDLYKLEHEMWRVARETTYRKLNRLTDDRIDMKMAQYSRGMYFHLGTEQKRVGWRERYTICRQILSARAQKRLGEDPEKVAERKRRRDQKDRRSSRALKRSHLELGGLGDEWVKAGGVEQGGTERSTPCQGGIGRLCPTLLVASRMCWRTWRRPRRRGETGEAVLSTRVGQGAGKVVAD